MTNEEPDLHKLQGDKSRRVFIVHGRNLALVEAVSTMLRSLGLEALDFSEVRLAESFRGRYIGEVLDHAFDTAQAILVVVSGEETAKLNLRFALSQDFPLRAERQPRPNVLIEIGMALRSHAERVIIVDFPPVRQISDLAGLVTLKFDGNQAKFQTELSARLRQAGCSVAAPKPVNDGIFRRALSYRRWGPIFRYCAPRIGLALAAAVLLVLSVGTWVQPNWCAAACRQARVHQASGDALWHQANENNQYLPLYKTALDEYYKAFRLEPDNLGYRASVAAVLNDVGEYDRTISEMVPFSQSTTFQSLKSDAHAWLLGEIAAAFAMKGDNKSALEYTEIAARTHPHFRDWVPKNVNRYRRQDETRRLATTETKP